VPEDHPYVNAIDYLTRTGIVEGYENRSFQPERAVSRAEFAKILVGMLFPSEVIESCIGDDSEESEEEANINSVIPEMKFLDVPHHVWFAPSICTAWRHGIIDGYADGTFRPEEGVNFAEAAKMLSLGFGLTGVELPNLGAAANAQWYRPYAEFLSAANAIPPSITAFDLPVTRSEMAEMLYRLKDFSIDLAPVEQYSLQPEDLEPAVHWEAYKNKAYGFTLEMPNVWPAPHAVPRGTFDGRLPYYRSLWTVYIGPHQTGCNTNGECVEREMWIDGYDADMAEEILRLIEADEYSIEVLKHGTSGEIQTLTLEEAIGNCIDKRTFLFGEKYVYVFNALCAFDNARIDHMLDRLVQSFREITIPSLVY